MSDRPLPGNDKGMPSPTQQERRVVRQKYRELMDQTQKAEEKDKSLECLTSTLVEADAIFDRLPQMPREAALDSKLVSQLSTLGAGIAQSLDTNVITFHPAEFTERLANFVNPVDKTITDWAVFGRSVSSLFRRGPSLSFMYGSFESDPPASPEKPKGRKAVPLSTATEAKQAPEKVSEMGKSDKEVTTAEVDKVLQTLRYLCDKHGGPLCFFEFAVHPESFAQTVLNIFHITFLIRDGYAIIYLDNDGLPVIEAITDKTGGPRSNTPKPVKNEVVLSMSKAQWRDIVDAFDITQAVIPTSRPPPGCASKPGGDGKGRAGTSGTRPKRKAV